MNHIFLNSVQRIFSIQLRIFLNIKNAMQYGTPLMVPFYNLYISLYGMRFIIVVIKTYKNLTSHMPSSIILFFDKNYSNDNHFLMTNTK